MFDSGGFGQSGGFMPQESFASPTEKPKNLRRKDNVFPVCIRQILEAPEDGLKFGTLGVHMVEFIAIVRNIVVDSASVEYLFDDNTGGLIGIHWIERSDTGDSDASIPNVVENAYYRVYGTIRSLQGMKYVQVVRIIALKDLNELTMHILEVIHKPLLLQKLSVMGSVKAPAPSVTDPSLSNSFMSNATISTVAGFSPNQQKVYNIILKINQDIGINKIDIAKKLEGQMNLREVFSAIEFLSTEGHIYSTIDEEHYRCTDN